MLRSYLAIALRNLARHPVQAVINVFGLAVAAACSLFVLLLIHKELTFDRFHENADRICRIVTEARYGKRTDVPSTLGPTLRDGNWRVTSSGPGSALRSGLGPHDIAPFSEAAAAFPHTRCAISAAGFPTRGDYMNRSFR